MSFNEEGIGLKSNGKKKILQRLLIKKTSQKESQSRFGSRNYILGHNYQGPAIYH